MSLSVYLTSKESSNIKQGTGIFVRENGSNREITLEEWRQRFPDTEPFVVQNESEFTNEIYSANITHNLGKMASEAGIYEHLWRPEEVGVTHANQLIEPLTKGLELLKGNPEKFTQFNPANGWGDYDGLVNFVEKYLEACKIHPSATVSVCR